MAQELFGSCRFGGRGAQGIWAHSYAFAVGRDDEHVTRCGFSRLGLFVVRLEVHRGGPGQLFHLALGHVLAARSLYCRHGLVERAPGRLLGGKAAQAVGVDLFGQGQGCVGWVEVLLASVTVSQAAHRYLAEHGGQGTAMAGLDGAVQAALGVDHLQPFLVLRAEVQVVLVELADDLAHV